MNRFLQNKKVRYGSISLALTAVIIAAVILVNVIFTALADEFQWRIDMTENQIFTLSDEAEELLGLVPNGEDGKPREVTVLFCSEEDVAWADSASRYVLDSVKDMAQKHDNIKLKFIDIYTNPSAVSKYKDPAGKTLTSQSVIITSGTEFRVYSIDQFFTYDSQGSQIVGYNGEQRLVSAILAVTQAESPVARYTVDHGETDALEKDSAILTLLYEVGFEVKAINLKTEEFEADDRLLLIFDPTADFTQSELSKIDVFLAEFNSMMVFFDHETPELKNLEEMLGEWGIAIARDGVDDNRDGTVDYKANLLVKEDTANSFDPDGLTAVGQYVEDDHIGADITKYLRESNYPKSVVFRNSGVIRSTFRRNDVEGSGVYYQSPVSYVVRQQYPVFTSSSKAVGLAGGKAVEIDDPDLFPFNLITLTRDTVQYDDGSASYTNVLACASTEFASTAALDSSYGNHAVLAYAASVMSREIIPVSLDCKYFTDLEINSITAKDANQYMIVLAVVPAGLIFIAGIYIMVRRRYS